MLIDSSVPNGQRKMRVLTKGARSVHCRRSVALDDNTDENELKTWGKLYSQLRWGLV